MLRVRGGFRSSEFVENPLRRAAFLAQDFALGYYIRVHYLSGTRWGPALGLFMVDRVRSAGRPRRGSPRAAGFVLVVLLLGIPAGSTTGGLEPRLGSSAFGAEVSIARVAPAASPERPDASSLNVSPPQVTPNPVDVNSTVTLVVNVSGGFSPYEISWHGLPAGCVSANLTNLSCAPSQVGNFSVYVSANDSRGNSTQSAPTNVTVNTAFEGSEGISPSAGPKPLNVTFYSFPYGGTPAYSFHWIFGDGTGSYEGNVTHSYSVAGNYTVLYWENDSGGGGLVWNTTISAVAQALSVNLTSRASIDVGQGIQFSANVSGGTGSYSISWSGLPSPCVPANASQLSACHPSTPGTYPIEVYVRDSAQELASGQFRFSVYAPPSVEWLRASRYSMDLGQTTVLNVAPSNGTGIFNFTWHGLPPGCFPQNLSFIDCTPSTPGTFPVNVTLVDSDGLTAVSPIVQIHVDPPLAVPSIFASTNITEVGVRSVNFTANASGGSGIYDFQWGIYPRGALRRTRARSPVPRQRRGTIPRPYPSRIATQRPSRPAPHSCASSRSSRPRPSGSGRET